MEDILSQIQKDAVSPKFAALRKSCSETLDLLQDETVSKSAEPYQLRERCLAPLQLALESRSSRLAAYAIGGIQRLLTDDRFQSSMECEEEERWLPMQVLNAVWSTPNLDEYTQVEIMKVLLNMTFTTAWCMNAKVITKIAELCFSTFLSTAKLGLRTTIVNTLTRILGVFYQRQLVRQNSDPLSQPKVSIDTFGTTGQNSVRTAVRATLTQLLTAITEKLREKQKLKDEEADSAIAEFTSNASGEAQSLTADIVSILKFLCGKLTVAEKFNSSRQTEPLLLEGIYAILLNLPESVKENQEFMDLVWQHLCPSLVSLLGNPVTDKSITQRLSAQDEMGRGGGCSSSAPNVHSSSAKSIYNIAVQLVRLVGNQRPLRPVLESVFHRMLLYPPPIHRLDALKSIHEVVKSPEKLLNLAGPTVPDKKQGLYPGSKRRHNTDIALLKLVVDAIQECCHCNDSSVCITSVNIMQDLLTSLEKLIKGLGLSQEMITEIHKQYREVEGYHSINDQLEPMSPDHATAAEYFIHSSPSKDIGDRISRDAENDYDSSESEEEGEKIEVIGNGHVMRCVDPESDLPNIDQGDDEDREKKEEKTKPSSLSQVLHEKDEVEMTFGQRMSSQKADFEEIERLGARDFIQSLLRFLPKVFQCYTMSEVDELILQFSSDVCSEIAEKHSEGNTPAPILNADGVYIATYSALLLNLKLIRCGYFISEEKSVPVSEQQFIDEILSTGLLLYLSPTWLSEVYFQFISRNIMEMAGYTDSKDSSNMALVQLLTDIDGLESRKVGGQLMSFARDSEGRASEPVFGVDLGECNPAVEAGLKFARRVLLVCWEGILDVLSVLVSGKSSCGITSSLSILLAGKEESRRAREAICTSLDGLQKAARLACILGLQDRCGTVFQQLAQASCVMEDMHRKEEKKPGKPIVNLPSSKPKLARLHAAHALSMDVVLSIGLEMGSHSGDCWRHVLRCCAHIAELEHTYFSMGNNQSSLPKVQNDQTAVQKLKQGQDFDDSELYSTMTLTAEPVAPNIDVPELIKQSSLESGWDSAITGGGVLNASQAAKVLCGLSQEVDRMFEDAATKLNMKALVSFLTELCKSSQLQLAKFGSPAESSAGGTTGLPVTALHLYRLGDIMLKSIHCGRPLLHIMRAWSIVAPHFVEAACHRDTNISKKAVHCIHEFVTTLLTTFQELPHCHFNESLCKPFENLLCLELCDGDVQDQIVCSICELVEACASDIKSGWRPLFGALRAVKIEFTTSEEVNEARQRHVAAVLDVFDVFLNTDNVLVFANAAVDCILCLLKYVRGPGEFQEVEDDDSDSGSEFTSGTAAEDLCLPALKYLQQCCSILSSMWKMPACPIFSGAHRIKMTSKPKCVDPVIPNMDLETFQKPFFAKTQEDAAGPDTISPPPQQAADSKSINSIDSGIGILNPDGSISTNTSPNTDSPGLSKEESSPKSKPSLSGSPKHNRAAWLSKHSGMWSYDAVTLEELDNHTGVLHVWFLALEGLANTVSTCPKNYQPQTLEMLFDLLRSAAQVPGPDFSMHCMNHLLLPMLQTWLRRGNQITGYWDSATANFKQCCGLCTDLVVEYIIQFANVPESQSSVEFMLKQLLVVLIECVAQPNEAMSRLGCACIKHCLLSTGPLLTEQMWYVTAVSIQHAFDVTLYCLRQLMTPFQADSDNFYGDIGNVRVAVRKDCSSIDCERLRQLAQQVFLLDSQRGTAQVIDYEREEDRSYIFLIYPPDHERSNNLDLIVTRVPFRSIVVGLLSHQILVQMLGTLMLQGTPHLAPSEKNILSTEMESPQGPDAKQREDKDLIQDIPLPGMLRYMSTRTALTLLKCLNDSVHVAVDFDARPGLKFLVQKVARAEVAANLYKQAGISCTFYMHSLLEIAAHQDNICLDNTQRILAKVNQQPDNEDHSSQQSSVSEAQNSLEPVQKHINVFVCQLKSVFDQVCTWYVDLYLDKEGPSKSDQLASQMLVFLLAEPEEIPQLKRDKKLSEMVKEKLKQREDNLMEASGAVSMMVEAVPIQGEEAQGTSPSVEDPPTTSPFSSPKKENKHKPDPTDKIYTVVSERKINDLMSEYKKRKQAHSMPSFVKATRSKPAPTKKNKPASSDPVDQEIEEQQKHSIMKDSEANLQSWIEVVCGILHLFHQLPDYQYQALLPVIFSCVNQLICHCKDPRLRETLAQWTYRIGHLYGIAPPGNHPPPSSPR